MPGGTDKSDLEKKISDTNKKIPDTSGLIKKSVYKSKINEIESKTPSTSASATTSVLPAVENKISDVGSLVKKQIMMQTLVKFKRKLLIMIIINILLLQNLII